MLAAAPPDLPTKSQAPVTIPQLFEALCARDQEHENRYALVELRSTRVEADVREIKTLLIEELQTVKAEQVALRTDINKLKAASAISTVFDGTHFFPRLETNFRAAVFALWALAFILATHEAHAILVK